MRIVLINFVDLVPVVVRYPKVDLGRRWLFCLAPSLVGFPFAAVNLGWSVRLAARGTLSRFAVTSAVQYQ